MKEKVKLIALQVILMLLPVITFAQQKDSITTSAKIDSIYQLQKKMYAETKTNPLSDKKFGIEVNLLRLLFVDKATTFSGSFSLFNVNRNAEIAFPFYYQNPKESDDLESFTLDCHFRYFLNDKQNGFYLSAFSRYAHLEGYLGDNDLFNQSSNVISSENKLGLGIGIGYRIFSKHGLYWGTSLSVGRYIVGENNKFTGDFLSIDDDSELILDFEFLKFGWAF